MQTQTHKQMELDLSKKHETLQQAIVDFSATAAKVASSLEATVARYQEPFRPPNHPTETVRATVRRLVGILVDQSGMSYHTIWVLAYHELFERTGFHAVAVGGKQNEATFLNMVAQAGRMDELKEVIIEMLQKKEYRRTTNPAST